MSASAARHGKHRLRAREARGVPHRALYEHRAAGPPHCVDDVLATRWKGEDFHIICDCQRHAIRERALWRRALRMAAQFKRSGAVLLVGLPLALGTVGIPIGATSGAVVERRPSISRSADGFRIFTTPKVRSQFLEPQTEPRSLTLEVTKEEFFRRNIPYGSIIYREAKKNQLAPELVAAVVEAESDFRPRLISGKNAQGLMQIVPSTGELLGVGNLFDPEQNIAAGSKYLKYLLDRFGGDHRLALAAYNAGEGNIEKFGGIPPFPETMSYVQRVNAHTRWYRQRIRETFAASSRVRTSYAH
jgi:Transglycosylase SLT domain